jgi:hypothetical protein
MSSPAQILSQIRGLGGFSYWTVNVNYLLIMGRKTAISPVPQYRVGSVKMCGSRERFIFF